MFYIGLCTYMWIHAQLHTCTGEHTQSARLEGVRQYHAHRMSESNRRKSLFWQRVRFAECWGRQGNSSRKLKITSL